MSEGIMTNRTTKESALCVQKDNLNLTKNKCSSPITSKKKNKKGGLSMFLSGALDDAPKYIAPPPPSPKSEGPAWGGAKIPKGFASLRAIQDEQSKTKDSQSTRNRGHAEDPFNARSDGKILLSSFLPSKPIPVVSIPVVATHTSVASDGERGTPPWTASGTPPLLSRPSLRDIQMQQVCELHPLSLSLSYVFGPLIFFVMCTEFHAFFLSCFLVATCRSHGDFRRLIYHSHTCLYLFLKSGKTS